MLTNQKIILNPFLCKIYMHFCTRRSLTQILHIFADTSQWNKSIPEFKIDQTLTHISYHVSKSVYITTYCLDFSSNGLLNTWKLVTSIFEYTIVIFYLDTRHNLSVCTPFLNYSLSRHLCGTFSLVEKLFPSCFLRPSPQVTHTL